MENDTRTSTGLKLSPRARILSWLLVALALAATFMAYGQMELALQWVSAQLC